MKKIIFFFNLIILMFFITNNSFCFGEDFFIDTPFENAKSKTKIEQNAKVENVKNTVKKKANFFSNLFNKGTSDSDEQKGYYGSIPNISGDFKYKNQDASSSSETNMKIPAIDELEEENLKKAPTDDALFLDVIIKKEKNSNYVNDIQRTKIALANLKKCLEENGDIQRFNACVNMVDMYTKNLKEKYQNKGEAYKESYIDIMNTNYHAKVLGNLLYDANYYARYVPTNNGQYSEQNITSEQEKLLNRINKTLFLINNET